MFNQEGNYVRGKMGTGGERMLIERDQESVKVIKIHSRDKGHLSKQEVSMGKWKNLSERECTC